VALIAPLLEGWIDEHDAAFYPEFEPNTGTDQSADC
jgi:hypothetical protein